jgi:DNA anti-recombination protein RmuC
MDSPRDEENTHDDSAIETRDLVERTEQLVRATEDHATELAERSAAAVAHLQEEMRLAERVLEAAETRRRVAEAEVKDLSEKLQASERSFQERIDALTSELKASINETERAYEERIEALTNERDKLLKRATRVEERASKAEQALERVQKTLQNILQIRPPATDLTSSSRLLGWQQTGGDST